MGVVVKTTLVEYPLHLITFQTAMSMNIMLKTHYCSLNIYELKRVLSIFHGYKTICCKIAKLVNGIDVTHLDEFRCPFYQAQNVTDEYLVVGYFVGLCLLFYTGHFKIHLFSLWNWSW